MTYYLGRVTDEGVKYLSTPEEILAAVQERIDIPDFRGQEFRDNLSQVIGHVNDYVDYFLENTCKVVGEKVHKPLVTIFYDWGGQEAFMSLYEKYMNPIEDEILLIYSLRNDETTVSEDALDGLHFLRDLDAQLSELGDDALIRRVYVFTKWDKDEARENFEYVLEDFINGQNELRFKDAYALIPTSIKKGFAERNIEAALLLQTILASPKILSKTNLYNIIISVGGVGGGGKTSMLRCFFDKYGFHPLREPKPDELEMTTLDRGNMVVTPDMFYLKKDGVMSFHKLLEDGMRETIELKITSRFSDEKQFCGMVNGFKVRTIKRDASGSELAISEWEEKYDEGFILYADFLRHIFEKGFAPTLDLELMATMAQYVIHEGWEPDSERMRELQEVRDKIKKSIIEKQGPEVKYEDIKAHSNKVFREKHGEEYRNLFPIFLDK